MPERIQLSRAKGWKMPPNTVKVDRTTKWGNPFIVGVQGNAALCVYHFGLLLSGLICLSVGHDCCDRQDAFLKFCKAQKPWYRGLEGKNLACWCRIGQPCHADLLLLLVNRKKAPLDINAFLARYGWAIERGEAVKLQGQTELKHE